jgi:phosphoribosylformylglycinamidine cyclo-ligase
VHKSYLHVIQSLKEIEGVTGFSHITGGGIVGNTKRILPDGLKLRIDWDAWDRPAIYKLIQKEGNVPEEDMRATFNLGIGLIVVAEAGIADQIEEEVQKAGSKTYRMGYVEGA